MCWYSSLQTSHSRLGAIDGHSSLAHRVLARPGTARAARATGAILRTVAAILMGHGGRTVLTGLLPELTACTVGPIEAVMSL